MFFVRIKTGRPWQAVIYLPYIESTKSLNGRAGDAIDPNSGITYDNVGIFFYPTDLAYWRVFPGLTRLLLRRISDAVSFYRWAKLSCKNGSNDMAIVVVFFCIG
jgi:hypothetical protein